jgi:CHAT domain-containing protein/tetratricopeptide (TPR) repeat protein
MHRKALAIRIEVLGERHFSTATSYNDLAMVLHFRGDPPDAEAMQRKALAIEVEVLGERHPFTATSYSNLALMLRDRGDPLGAEAMQRKALAIEVEVLGERHPATSRSYNNLALELKERGDLAGAEAMQRKALAIEVEVLGERHPDTAAMYGNLAQVLRDRGDLAGAEAMQRKALAIRIEVLGERHPRTAASYDNLGTVLDDLGRTGEAIDALENAVHAASGARGGNARGLEDAARDLVQPHPLLAVLLARTGRPVDAWDRWESGLSRALLDEVAGRAARPLTPDEREREAALLGQAQAGDERIGRLLAGGEPTPEIERRLEDVRRESSEARRQLLELQARFEKSYGPLAGRPATLDAVRAALDDHTALVGWVDAGRRHWACVARRTGDPVWVDIPGGGEDGAWTKDEQALADRLRAALASTSLKDDWRPMAEAMAKQRLAPLGPHLEEARRVVVVNSPGLAGVPVELLFEARAGAGGAAPVVSYAPSASMFAYLVGRKSSPSRPDALLAVGDPAYPEPGPAAASPPPPSHGLLVAQVVPNGNADLHGVRSGDVLLAYDGATLKAQADLRVAPADGPPRQVPMTLWRDGQEQAVALAIGPLGVALDPRPAAEVVLASRAADEVRRGSRAGAWPRLPETRLEVEAIAGMFPDGGATTLLGDQARESVVQDLARTGRLRTFRYLHFATHGRDDPASAYRTALILAPDPDQGDDPAASDPLDGEITAEQIARTWNLDADLVVLSACETALGKRAGGEGLLGFTQPLLAKGARSLVLSLWQVNDRSTALLMTRFYRNMLGKRAGLTAPMPKAEALAEAKRWLREATSEEVGEAIRSLPRGEIVHRDDLAPPPSARPYEDPRHWAPFILVGAPD